MNPAELQWVNCEPSNQWLRLQSNEIEAICKFLPRGQNIIHYAIRCDVRLNRQVFRNSVVVLSNYFVLVIGNSFAEIQGTSKPTKEPFELCKIHIDDIDLIGYSKDRQVLITTKPANLMLMDDSRGSNKKLAQLLYRNYQMIYAAYDKNEMKMELRADNMADFPDIDVYVSPSQKFQFLYNALCTKTGSVFHQEVVRYIHSMVLYGGSIVDLSQIPIDDYGVAHNSYDLRPMFRALALQKYVCGVCCNTPRPNIMYEIQDLMEESHKLQIIHVTNCGVTAGLEELLEASKKKVGLPIRYWNISGNKFAKFDAFITLLECTKNPLEFLDISDCGLSANDAANLYRVMAGNNNLHEIQQLSVAGMPMDDESFDAFAAYLKAMTTRVEKEPSFKIKLQSFNIGHLEHGLDRYLEILNNFQVPIKKLSLAKSTLDQNASNQLISYLQKAETLRCIDLGNTKISAENVADIVAAISENKNLHHFDLRLDYLELTTGNLLPIFRVFLSGNLNRWRSLSFNGNNMTGDDLRNLIPLLKMMKHLHSLSLSDNFDDTTPNIEDILPKLLSIPNLTKLVVAGGTHKLKKKIIPLISELRHHKNIVEIDISGNAIGDEGLSAVINYIKASKYITEVKIDGSEIHSIDLLAALVDVIRDGKHKQLITLDFPVMDSQSIVRSLEPGTIQRDAIHRLSDIQCKMVDGISQNRAIQGKPGRLPFEASPEITAIITDISKKSRDEFIVNEDPLAHTFFCEEIGLTLPYQKEGDLVGDGGKVKKLSGLKALKVYETDALLKQVIEDKSHYVAPTIVTESSHFGTSSVFNTEQDTTSITDNRKSRKGKYKEDDESEEPRKSKKSRRHNNSSEEEMPRKSSRKSKKPIDVSSEEEMPRKSSRKSKKQIIHDSDEDDSRRKKSDYKKKYEMDDVDSDELPRKKTASKRRIDSDEESPNNKRYKKQIFDSESDDDMKKHSQRKSKKTKAIEESPRKRSQHVAFPTADSDDAERSPKSKKQKKYESSEEEQPVKKSSRREKKPAKRYEYSDDSNSSWEPPAKRSTQKAADLPSKKKSSTARGPDDHGRSKKSSRRQYEEESDSDFEMMVAGLKKKETKKWNSSDEEPEFPTKKKQVPKPWQTHDDSSDF